MDNPVDTPVAAPQTQRPRLHDIRGRSVYAVAGLPFDALNLDAALRRIERAVRDRQRLFISTPNANFAVVARTDPAFRRSVLMSDLVVPDGMPLVFFAKLQRLPVQGRVTGADLFEQLLVGARCPVKVFFYGGPPGAAEAACARVNQLGGPLLAVGFASPGYGSVEALSDDATIAQINGCEPDFVVVALGAQKGQAWILHNRDRLHAPVISHLGAVVNFTAGSVRRAPQWVQSVHAEWLWRVYQEPALWRRYWHDGLALLQIFSTQVLPNLFRVWLSRGADKRAQGARIHTQVGADATLAINLSGNWRNADVAPLAAALQAAMDAGQGVDIHVAELVDLDACAIGLLMLAQVRLPSVRVIGASGAVASQLRRHGAGDLYA